MIKKRKVVVNQTPFRERDKRGVCDQTGTVHYGVKRAKLLVENLNLPLGIGAIGKVSLLEEKARLIRYCRTSPIQPTNQPAFVQKLVEKEPAKLASNARNQN